MHFVALKAGYSDFGAISTLHYAVEPSAFKMGNLAGLSFYFGWLLP